MIVTMMYNRLLWGIRKKKKVKSENGNFNTHTRMNDEKNRSNDTNDHGRRGLIYIYRYI